MISFCEMTAYNKHRDVNETEFIRNTLTAKMPTIQRTCLVLNFD